MKLSFFCIITLLANTVSLAQQEVDLWEGDTMPYSKPHSVEEYEAPCWFTSCAYDVSEPTLTIYQPDGDGTGDVILVIPGGGYDVVAIDHEGHDIARAFADNGITAAVLKYRLPDPRTSDEPGLVPITDARKAIRMLRENQDDWGIDVERVGVLGFSAGAHLATQTVVHHSDEPTENPDFSIHVYGVTRMSPDNLEWLETSLYHRALTDAEIAQHTFIELVDEDTVPAFLVHALDDTTCPYSETTEYAEALTKHGVDAEVHLYARGGHGFSVGRAEDGTDQWISLASQWVQRHR